MNVSLLLPLAQMEAVSETTLQWVIRSEGPFLWPQTLLAILAITLVLSALDVTRRRVFLPRRFRRELEQALARGDRLLDAIQLAKSSSSPLARVVRAGLQACQQGSPLPAVESELERACEDISISMDRRLGWIVTLAHVAMTVGLLGTVCGLVGSFTVIGQKGEAPPPNELAEGVSMALATTIIGLLTAIPALMAHGYLRTASNRLLYQLHGVALDSTRSFFRLNSISPSGQPKGLEQANASSRG